MTRPLSVLHAHSGNLFGGVETILLTLARLPGRIQHSFALSYEDRLAGRLRSTGTRIDILGAVHFRKPWSLGRARRKLVECLAAQTPDVVMCHSPWGLAAYGPVARARDIPLALWAHSPFTGRHWTEWLAGVTATPDIAVCNSEFTRASLPKAFPKTRTEVIYPPVAPPPTFDPARRTAKREGHGADADKVVLTLVARLEPWKGHAHLLDALAILRDLPDWTAWIVGGAQKRSEDVYRASLERRANEARIAERVHFLGQRDDIASLLWVSDVYCQPNTQAEPFGISLVEALYAGLPVVTTALGGAREIITPECGILVTPNQPQALANTLRSVITDAGLRSRLGAAAPKRAAALCSPDAAVAHLADVLISVSRGTG